MNDPRANVIVPRHPKTPVRTVTDIVHGVAIEDPYRWLEDGSSQETLEWTEVQNKRTEEVLSQVPSRPKLQEQLLALLSEESVGSPVYQGKRLFYLKREPGRHQPVLCMRELSGVSPERVILDPNLASERGIVALDWWRPSRDGSLVAFGYSERGDEWSVLHVLDVDQGTILPDRIRRARGAAVDWDLDGKGFHYGRYPEPGQVPPGEENYNKHLYHHTLGTSQEDDPKLYGEGRPRHEMYGTSLSNDGKHLLLSVSQGWNSTDLYVKDASRPDQEFAPIVQGIKALFRGTIHDGVLYTLTNHEASNYKIVSKDVADLSEGSWKDVVSEDPEMTITSFHIVGGHLVVTAMKDATSKLFVYDLDGTGKREIPLGLGSVGMLTGSSDSPEVFFEFQSFVLAPAIYRFYVDGEGRPEVVLASAQSIDPSAIVSKQVFYESKDGTKVPMFILHRSDLPLGQIPHPTVLTGYGGFNLPRIPTYNAAVLPWITAGGILASANLRGGNEYGEKWHRAGMRENKQNVFDDFISAGEYLIREGYTDKEHLGIWGRSNGGLLVGAAMTQRPELFKAVSCGVPLLDMVRYHKFLIAFIWTSEYGDPDKPDEFQWLYAYSPYHRVEDVAYPATFIYTAASDSRVDPMGARKMTAKLQAAQDAAGTDNPILLVVESDAGHGVGKPVYKVVEEQSNMWAFLAWQLGLSI